MNTEAITVLLVEDNPGDARLIEEELTDARGMSFELVWKDRLKEGLNYLTEDTVDVVLLDLSLPDSQGLDTVLAVHEADPGTPIVVLTGLEDEQLGARAVRSGAQDYLVKGSVDGDRLARSMQYAIERKQATQELEQMRKQLAMSDKLAALGALVSGVAAEIRTSTTHITNTLFQVRQRIEQAARTDPSLREIAGDVADYSAAAMDGVSRIDGLVRDLRRFTQSGAQERAPQSLHTAVEEAVELFRKTHESRINVEASLNETPPILLNKTQIQQVVLNLLNNAAEAMPEGGSVTITTQPANGGGELVIEDEGQGMTQYVKTRMFDPFFTTHEQGAGLGLAISNRIVDAHGGRITCETESGVGSTFTVFLPEAHERD